MSKRFKVTSKIGIKFRMCISQLQKLFILVWVNIAVTMSKFHQIPRAVMALLLLLLLLNSSPNTALPVPGNECSTVEGSWYDEYGTELHINEEADGTLSGMFVSHSPSQRNRTSNIIGFLPYDLRNATFSLVFLTNDETWTAALAGQCIMCDGEETLKTSWIQRQHVQDCEDKWESTLIGISIFKRYSPVTGTGKIPASNPLQLPPHPQEQRPQLQEETRTKREAAGQVPVPRPATPCSILGDWHNTLGSKMHISLRADNIIEGYYQTAAETEAGAAGPEPPILRGTAIDGNSHTLIAFNVLWNNGTSTTAWVGQCHVCGLNQTEAIQTSWVLKSKVRECEDNWHSTRFGEDFFTRYKQTD